MTLPRSVLIAIAEAVEGQGGDFSDVEDLIQVWERVNADQRGRRDHLRHGAAHPVCHCQDGGVPSPGQGRCERCEGILNRQGAEI